MSMYGFMSRYTFSICGHASAATENAMVHKGAYPMLFINIGYAP